MAEKLAGGVVHQLPTDLRKALLAAPQALAAWQDSTPLARNEWICWTITVKTAETRKSHIERVVSELIDGMRRPCCWVGCIHRKDKAMSRSQTWVTSRRTK